MTKNLVSKKRIAVRICVIVLASVLTLGAVCFAVSAIIYESVFGKRFETADYLRYDVSEFEGLVEERMTFRSGDTELQGYLYSREGLDAKGVVVVCHGFGAGSNQYMDSAYCFVMNGFYTFMYDSTGNDLSGGSGTRGIPQYTLDLDAAISFVREDPRLKDLPLMLFGQSMGGFSVCNVLNLRDDVASVAELCGFCESTDMMKAEGEELAGKASLILLPFVRLYELLKFGKTAEGSAISGLEGSDCTVMVVHSEDDDTVPIAYGYDRLYGLFSGNDRFTFVKYENRGHVRVDFSDEALAYIEEFNKAYREWYESTEPSDGEAAEYKKEHLDRSVWTNANDKDLYAAIVKMFTEAAEKG